MNLKSTYTIFLTLLMAFVASCSDNAPESERPQENLEELPQASFRVNALGVSSAAQSGPQECIKSLRVIIINSDGLIEANEKTEWSSSPKGAATFSHIFSKSLNSKSKDLYLIANEESIGDFSLTDSEDLPSLPSSSLSDLLDYFRKETAAENSGMGDVFGKVLNRIYFENDLSNLSAGNMIYLPYSAHYKLEANDLGLSGLTHPLYLVPVASKIDFSFVSYRSHDTRIEDVSLNNANVHNYLNAQLANDETLKPFNDKMIWWIDWLQECAKNSETAEDIEDFNEKWGWIQHYSLPLSNDASVKSLKPSSEVWKIDRMADKNNPDRKSFGPFYIPESKSSSYELNFEVTDLATNETTFLEGYEIDTMMSLFRATHVKIFIELYEKAMDIYSEVVPWNEKVFIGYVQEDDD
ncbi:MAG: hypothetical protein J1D77_03120 [Muribaculaceae bacterium]|nr:hypothetical protein [Muribaculaceae bacterium]